MPARTKYLIDVSTTLPKDRLDAEDQDVAGTYLLELDEGGAAGVERALDLFHEIVPIAVLDDFSIHCRALADTAAVPPGVRRLYPNDAISRRFPRAGL